MSCNDSRVIARDEVMPLLLKACPSFRERWDDHVTSPSYEADLLYVDLGEFAHHLVELMKTDATAEFPAVFDAIERIHVDGDSYVKEAATIGLLEGIQNVAGNNGISPESFARYLKPESAGWWVDLNSFWDGKSPNVGAGIAPEK